MFKLTNPQNNIWNNEIFFHDTNINNICGYGIIKEVMDFEKFKESIYILVKNNDSFRIRLCLENGIPCQFINDFSEFDIEIIDVNSEEEFSKILNSTVSEKFDIFNSNLFKAKLARFSNGYGALILNVHHIISDSWSLGITIQEVVKIYHCLVRGEAYVSDTSSYLDYISSEEKYMSSNLFSKDKLFWNSYLQDLPIPVGIPYSSNNHSNSSAGSRATFYIDIPMMNKIADLCEKLHISNYVFFMSVISLFLANSANTDDILIGTPILNRSNFKEKRSTGMFVTTVPFRTKVSENMHFSEFLATNRTHLTSILRHQKYPYSCIMDDLSENNDKISHLYNVAVSYQITKTLSRDIGDYETDWIFTGNCMNDVSIHLYDLNDTGALKIDYDFVNKYTLDDVRSWHLRILSMIEQILDNPDLCIHDIQFITDDEKSLILNKFNNRTLLFPTCSSVIELFEKHVLNCPDNIACVYNNTRLSYIELNKLVNKFARFLSENGVKKGDIVGVCMDKNNLFIVSILAVLKLGAAYLPIHPDYPEDRISYILSDSNSKLLICENDFNFKNILTINPAKVNLENYDSCNINTKICIDDLCYVIYTSGSTGKPKGVMLTHGNLINFVNVFNDCFENHFSEQDVCLSVTNISFDVSVCEIFTPLCFGSTLVLYPNNTLTDIPLLCEILDNEKVTFLYIPPNVLNDVFDFINEHSINFSVNKMLVGVESIKKSDLYKYFSLNNDIEIVNGYGPTEATICSTFYKYTIDDNQIGNVPIGYPLKNNNIFIVNRFCNLMPVSYPGELLISGKNVCKGYLNNEEMNKKSFTYLPAISEDSVFYKTGDIAYWDNSGYLCFVGRNDSQIKFKGHRIELNEINNVIKNIDGVQNSITLIKPVNEIDCICSYVVLDDKNITISDIKEKLSNLLPYYMLPSHIVFLDAFPITKNGKIDKANLPEIMSKSVEFVKPTTLTEIKLHNMLCELLFLSEISTKDNLFELGMDSLHAIRFSLEIYNVFDKNINISDLFKHPTISSLAKLIEDYESTSDKLSDISIAKKMPSYPLSSAQKRIYYASKVAGSSLVYNISGGILIDKLLDVNKIRKVFQYIIDNNSSFRTYFKIEDGEPRQYVLDEYKIDIPCFDDGIVDNNFVNNLVNNFPKVFDLDFAPLIRFEVHFVNSSTLILIDSHHIILDGTSLNILISEFCNLYESTSLSNINKKEIDYKDYTMWEQSLFNSATFLDCQKYWKNRYNNYEIPVINLPYDFPVSNKKSFIGKRLSFPIDKDLFDSLSKLANNYHVSEYMVFLSALYLLLYKYTGQENIIIGSPIEARYSVKLKNIIGMFVNNVAFNINIDGKSDFEHLLLNVKDMVLDGLSNQPYPYDTLVKDLNIASNSSIFDVVFTYQNENDKNDFSIDNSSLHILGANIHTAKFPLTVEINPFSLEISLEYNSDLFKEETICSMYEHYLYLLQNIAKNINMALDDISSITDSEKKLLSVWNSTDGEINDDTVVSLFEEQVRKNPDNVAVICDDKFLSYKELNQKANSLAHYLISIGIKPNDIVCIMTNRSLETIVCMLGILKAGGAFLNVDPTYPIERTKYYLNDCNAKYILFQKCLADKVSEIENRIEIDLYNPLYNKNMENPNVKVNPFDLSYIIYTSGSTGKPKGVMLHQVGFANMIKAMGLVLDYLKEGNKHCIASVTSTPFDIFVYEIFVSLGYGLKVLMANNAEHRNPVLLDGLIKKYGADVMTVTPSLMKINYDNRLNPSALSCIKHMVFGGEPLPEKFVQDLRELSPGVTIYNIYGPSEITVLCNVQNLTGEERITIGPPILNTQIHILDKNRHPVPIGVVGEIYISGIQVGLGYLGKPEMTNEKFIDNPFGTGKMYQSGDIGRWTFDGKVQCLGRIDNQIKLRGLRIELGEIEGIIEKIPHVISAVAHKVDIGDKEVLCGYYVCDKDNLVLETDVKEALKKALPPYMVPSYIIRLDEMPYTINRKIDRKALPIPDITDRKVSRVINENKTRNEEKLWKIWKKVLNNDSISIYDNFFDIGGDSISAINMQIEALKDGFHFEYADIFNFPTIHDLASVSKHVLPKNDIEDYDYSKFDEILNKNSIENLDSIRKTDIGNVLLIGVTGYLGSHLIYSFLKNEPGDIYCLIRKKDFVIPSERLKNTLLYYFGEKFFEKYRERIHILEGDITIENIGLSKEDYSIVSNEVSTVINSGAIVKHFGDKSLFEKVNVHGTENVVSLCKDLNKRLIHISTISVSGNGEKEEAIIETPENINDKVIFSEKDLFVGQNIKGVYTVTKFKAERIILEAILDGLDAQILRIGNISNRYSDGMFQRNIDENAFAKRIQSFIKIGAFPEYALGHEIEVTPVDLCADAIIRIAEYKSNCSIFHIYDTKLLSLKLFVQVLKEIGIQLIPVSTDDMSKLIDELLQDDNRKDILSGIIHDLDKDKHLVYTSRIRLSSEFTEKYLNFIGFYWKNIDRKYIIKYINYFKKIKFLE